MSRSEITTEVAKATPPAVVVAANKIMGLDLPTLVAIATLLYLLIQTVYLIWKWRNESKDRSAMFSRRRQDGKIHPRLLYSAAALSAGALAFSLAPIFEGTGPTVVVEGETHAVAYADPAHGWSVPTICHGHTRGVFRGQTATLGQCQEWLVEDISHDCSVLSEVVTTPITQRQYDALCMWAINVGRGGVRSSKLVRYVNSGDCLAAAREFNASPQIDRATGKPRIWRGPAIVDRQTKEVLLATGAPIMKWTTASLKPLPGLIKRRAEERRHFEADCPLWSAQPGEPAQS